MADWDILIEIRNRYLVGVQDRFGLVLKSGQAVVKHTDGELVASERVPVWLLYVFTGLLSRTPADCVIVSLSRALTLWWVGGRVFLAQRQHPAGGKSLQKEDRWARQPAMRCDVKRFCDLQQASQEVFFLYFVCLFFFLFDTFLEGAPVSRFTHGALVSLLLPQLIKMKKADSQFSFI